MAENKTLDNLKKLILGNKYLTIIAIIVLAVILYFYVKSLKEDYYYDSDEGIVVVDADGPIPDRTELPQNWSKETRELFWFTSQGSDIMPYDWFTWLEQSNNDKLFRNSEFMESLGYLPMGSSMKNPSGLPIGFAITRARKNQPRVMGMTCAACHTNQINYNGTKMLIEGAPTLANFVKFFSEIVNSLDQTYKNDDKFERFAKRVLADSYSQQTAEGLRTQVQQLAEATAERQAVNDLPSHYPKDFTSYARLDAFGNIMNAGTAFGLHDLANKNSPTGPVSYPFLWGTHQSDVVQWNASAPNTPVVGPLVRNVGEVVGVFGNLSIHEAPWWQQILGIDVAYSSTVDFRGLGELESWVMDLRSPEWPEQILPPIDIDKAAKGAIIFADKCQRCHEVISREDEGKPYISNKTLVSKLGTDPVTADNAKNRMAKTLILDGVKQEIILGDPFGVKAAAIEIPVNGVVGVVLKRPISAIKAGLIPAKHKGIKADEETLRELLAENLEARNKHDKISSDSLVYKGRPLNGIWATAPFLHNGSIPNLWELMKAPEERVKEFHVGDREFDPVNVGFVTGKGPSIFNVMKQDSTIMPGNSNLGHDYGTSDLTDEEKWQVIEYMKTL
ncbi:MAG: di-heme-cytochrome C peroxidase [Bacteroidota bacterium]